MEKSALQIDYIKRIFEDSEWWRGGYFLSNKYTSEDSEYITFYYTFNICSRLFYKNHLIDGERAVYNEDGSLAIRDFLKNGDSYSIKDAEIKFPEGPWLDSII